MASVLDYQLMMGDESTYGTPVTVTASVIFTLMLMTSPAWAERETPLSTSLEPKRL